MVLSRRLVERGEGRGDFCGFSLSLSFVRSVGGSLDRAKYHLPGLNQCHADRRLVTGITSREEFNLHYEVSRAKKVLKWTGGNR